MASPSQEMMLFNPSSETLASEPTPAMAWEQDAAKRALDELFSLTFRYKTSKSYQELLRFVSGFRFYSPFNAMLVHIQMSGATFVAPPHRWLREYGRSIKPNARPLVILQPMGPVMFVFDASDTEPVGGAQRLPLEVENPFEVRHGNAGGRLEEVIENAKRDGVRITQSRGGSQSAGSMRLVDAGVLLSQQFQAGSDKDRKPVVVAVPVRYDLVVNANHSREAQYVTISHELAHLYCGHLGTPDKRWRPDRLGLDRDIQESEAESLAFLVCARSGIGNPSETYLASYVQDQERVLPISLDCVMKAAGLIETMSQQRMMPRKASKDGPGG